jgi:hypothetical protein
LEHVELLLGKVPYREAFAFGNLSLKGLEGMRNGLDERRFALAVGT